MSAKNISAIVKDIKVTFKQHSPEILTGVGIAGMVTTTVLAVKVTPKAVRLLEEKKRELETEKLSIADTVKSTWKCYVPAVVTGVASVACLVGASSVHLKRKAALTAAYTLSDKALREYQDKVVETIGEKKEKTVREAIAQDKIDSHPMHRDDVVDTGKGTTLCYDYYMGRYFWSDIDVLKKAENAINSKILDEGSVSLNDFYYEIGLCESGIGDDLGWNYNRDKLVKLNLTSHLKDDIPCAVVAFQIAPYHGYEYYYG